MEYPGADGGKRAWPAVYLLLLIGLSLFALGAVLAFAERRAGWRGVLGDGYVPVLCCLIASVGLLAMAFVDAIGVYRERAHRRARVGLRLAVHSLFLLAVLSWCLLAPFERRGFELMATLACGAYSFAILLHRRLAFLASSRFIRWVDVILLNLLVCWIGSELILRGIARVRPAPILARAEAGVLERIAANRMRPGEVRYGFPCDSAGNYDEELTRAEDREKPLVVSIGDSFAAGVVPHYHNFTSVSERVLNRQVEVYNLGMPAIGPEEYVYLLENEALPLEPDAVVLNLFVGNDLKPSGARAVRPGFPWSCFDRDAMLSLVVAPRIFRVISETRRVERSEPVRSVARNRVVRDPEEIARVFPWVVDPMREQVGFSDDGILDIEARYMIRMAEREWLRGPALDSLERARELCGEIPLIVAVIPTHAQVEDTLWQRIVPRVLRVESDRFLAQQTLAEWLGREGIESVDYLDALRALEPLADGKIHAYHRNDTHFNTRGNRVAGEVLGEKIGEVLELDGR